MNNDIRKKAYIDALCKVQDSLSSLYNYWATDERRDVIDRCIEIIEEMKDEEFQYKDDVE